MGEPAKDLGKAIAPVALEALQEWLLARQIEMADVSEEYRRGFFAGFARAALLIQNSKALAQSSTGNR